MARRLDRLPRAPVALPGWDVRVAARLRARLLGLAWLKAPPPRSALLLPRTRSVHTFGMRFALDLLWLDANGHIVRVDRAVVRRRVLGCPDATQVVEAPAGSAGALLPGHRLLAPNAARPRAPRGAAAASRRDR